MTSPILRILYVEDNVDTRELVTILLSNHNCDVVAVEEFDKALDLARSSEFDLYLLDNWLPEGTGLQLCVKLREFDSKTPVLFYSAAAYDNDKQTAILSGAQGYLAKPSKPGELVTEVFRLIQESKAT